MENKYLSENQANKVVVEIARLLNGVSAGQSRAILKGAENFICDCLIVDTDSPGFKAKSDMLAESETFCY
ncbi:MAG: hypothetical protein GY749_02200 [Desulfobacteraceae bacterium]|nr:hypothetical protein [Desulfobacteraceae bacterium]